MRGDAEYTRGVLDELEAIFREASGVPMRRGRAIVDRADVRVMLNELRDSLPADLAEAEAIRSDCRAIIAAAEEEAERVVEGARERAEAYACHTEVLRRSQRRAAEIVERAERYAGEVAEGSEAYQDRVMGQLETWFQDSLVSVGESRQELGEAPTRRRVRTEPSGENGERSWRASSA